MIPRVVLLSLILATSIVGQAQVPDTPAGRVFAAWLAAFNSGDRAQLQAFDAAYRDKPQPVEDQLEFRERTGGFTLVRVEKSEPTSIVALVQEKEGDTIGRVEMTVSAGDPPKIVSERSRQIPRPADLALPRMSETDALAALSARVDALVAADRFSGIVLIARNGKTLQQKTGGREDRDKGTPVTADTKFRIGSMNKMFTAVTVLRLVQQGKLSLDDRIEKHLPDYPARDVATKVTIRHLLTHTGGTGDIFGPEFAKNRLTLKEHSDYVKLYGSRGLLHEPGAEFRYSNYGYVLLGAIIERVTGMTYYNAVKREVYGPAGMSSSGSEPETTPVEHRSTGYMRSNGAWVPNIDTLPFRGMAAGGGYSTAGDLLRFAQALESGKLLSRELLKAATTPNLQDYGFGFGIRGEGPLRWYGHNGGAPGMNGDLRIFPESGYVIVALSNVDPPAASRLAEFFALRMPATRTSS